MVGITTRGGQDNQPCRRLGSNLPAFAAILADLELAGIGAVEHPGAGRTNGHLMEVHRAIDAGGML